MTMRSLIGLTCLLVFSINAYGAPEKQIWRDSGLTPEIALGVLGHDQRCAASAEQAMGCLNAARALVQRYQPRYGWQISSQQPDTAVRSFGDVHLIDLPAPMSKHGKALVSSSMEAFARDQYAQIYEVLLPMLTWVFEELVPEDEQAFAASVLLNAYYRHTRDAYTHIAPTEALKQRVSSRKQEMIGVGIVMEATELGLLVQMVIPDSPAATAGLMIGDRIVQVDDVKIESDGKHAVSDALLGEEHSRVHITVHRKDKVVHIDAVREKFTYSTSYSFVKPTFVDGPHGEIAVIQISTFLNRHICEKTEAAILEAELRNVAGIVLDLRDNGGGLLTQATCVADLFIERGKKLLDYRVVRQQPRRPRPHYSKRTPLTRLPVVLLQNEHSASAAEILAVILQDYRRAAIIGRPSFGKGIVQTDSLWLNEEPYVRQRSLYDLRFYQTTDFYESPRRRLVHHVSVIPDFLTGPRRSEMSSEVDTPGSPPPPATYVAPTLPPFAKALRDCMAQPLPVELEGIVHQGDPDMLKAKHYFWCQARTAG